jgi:hypothetical protein
MHSVFYGKSGVTGASQLGSSVVPVAEHVPTTSTTVMDGPSPTPMMTNQDRGEVTVEGEVASRREPPR